MISWRALMGLLTISLLLPGTIHAMEPVNLDDSVGTFSSIKIAKSTESKPKTFAPYLMGSIASWCLGTLSGETIGINYYYNSSLPWWEATDKCWGLVSTIRTAFLLAGLYLTHKAVERDRELKDQLATIQQKTRTIVGDSSFLDAIRSNNVKHMNAWIAYDNFLMENSIHTISHNTLKEDTNRRTPIMLAAMANSTDVLKLLLEYYKEIKLFALNETDKDGNTALHLAAQHGNYNAVPLLLEDGADPSIKNYAGKTAAQMVDPLDVHTWRLLRDHKIPQRFS